MNTFIISNKEKIYIGKKKQKKTNKKRIRETIREIKKTLGRENG